jgi:hypothetical protein
VTAIYVSPLSPRVHVQSVAAAVWTVTHNLGRKPLLAVTDSTGRLVRGTVRHVSDSQFTVTFKSGFAGRVSYY